MRHHESMANCATSCGFSVVLPCVHTFFVDSSSSCLPPLCLPSPALSRRHGYYLIPHPRGTDLSLNSCDLLRDVCDNSPRSRAVFLKPAWSGMSSAPSLRQRVTSPGIKIGGRGSNAFVLSLTLSAQKGKNSCVAPSCCQELMRADR